MTPNDFVDKWQSIALTERSAAQQHFLDLCALLGHPTPAQDDPTGQRFTFEAGVTKQAGGQGWADVWKKGTFAWEYKGKHADLDKAYRQLLQYRESLQNPPLLVVSDINRIIVHTNFTNSIKREVTITLKELLTVDGMRNLRAIFYEPEAFRAPQTTEQVTRTAASEFARLADHLRQQGQEPARIAHFLIRLLFCLFAEDIDLLPKALFSRLVDAGRRRPGTFAHQLQQVFGAMATGGFFGEHEIRHFDGGLFNNSEALDLDRAGLDILFGVTRLDWSNIEPSIFGTLFERSLDPLKRSQLGAHYTSRDDILLIVEPVLMAPLRRRWAEVQTQASELAHRRVEASDQGTRTRRQNELNKLLLDFALELSSIRVLDPACGSGNFLYVALKQLLDLEKAVSNFTADVGANRLFPQVNPEQLFGIEINDYAYELAQATVWIGYIQWLHDNGFGVPAEPILKPLDNIKHMDAILAYDENGQPVEPVWPLADVVVGNPPFLGDKKMRSELGDIYVDNLRSLYGGRIPGQSDLVCYWFEAARAMIARDQVRRVGLLATNSIRGGANRRVLERIKDTGDIFWALSDRDWILEGAAVNVSMIGFDKAEEITKTLDGRSISSINPDLTGYTNLTIAQRLRENSGIAFIGDSKKAKFEISEALAKEMIKGSSNPHGRSNREVTCPWINGLDVTERSQNMWIIDFGIDMSEEDASLYEHPYEYVRVHVKPSKEQVRNELEKSRWWLHARPAPDMRIAIGKVSRYVATSNVSKHRLFAWFSNEVLPSHSLTVFARDDNYFFGILHSKLHGLWSLRMGTSLEDRPRYTPTTTFETFPFPWPPGHEAHGDPRVQAIAQAAKELVTKRDTWLNPPGLGESELKKRTLTNLYNARPTWLDLAHKKLDLAVFAAYGWPADLSDEDILARLLDLNLKRANPKLPV